MKSLLKTKVMCNECEVSHWVVNDEMFGEPSFCGFCSTELIKSTIIVDEDDVEEEV
jgi:hypothetical protein